MPTYPYKCSHCNKVILKKMTILEYRKAKITCECGEEMKRTYQNADFILKGNGYYLKED
ncbi:MAG: FmdB family zinc ribbon protein [Candidatus Muiribacteriota bacterium]